MKRLLLSSCLLLFGAWLSAAEKDGGFERPSSSTNHPSQGGSSTNRVFKVMAYNVHNFLLMDRDRDGLENDPKPEAEKEVLYTIIAEEAPDVLALVEVGGRKFLEEIQEGLKKKGREYPHDDWVEGSDHSRHVCLLSRFPIVDRQPHTEGKYRLGNQELGVSRGFIEADIQIAPDYRLKVYVAHLKSKRAPKVEVEGGADAMRLEEAKLLRQYMDEDLTANPKVNLLAMGDLNDTPDSPAIKTILSATTFHLFDLCPRNAKGFEGTYYYRPKKKFERIDYLIVSEGLKREYIEKSARIRDDSLSWKASDHFPIQASFCVGDR